MILFFEDVDNLLRTIHTGVRVEQRRVVGRIEHHVGTHLFGIGFDRGKTCFWIGSIISIRFFISVPSLPKRVS